MSEPRAYYPLVDGLRAIAVLLVVGFHLDIKWLNGGFIGVDIFFVISGYLITKSIRSDLAAGTFRFRNFFYRRTRRLLPSILIVLVLVYVAGFFLYSPKQLIGLSESGLFALFSLANVYFYETSGYFSYGASFKPLLHFWSLAVEEQFYIFWACLLFYLARKRYFVFVLTGLGLVSFAGAWVMADYSRDMVFYLTPFRIFEFAIGAGIPFLPAAWNKWQGIRVAAGLAVIGVSLAFINKGSYEPWLVMLVPCLGAALVITGKEDPLCGRLAAGLPGFLRLGRISYSLYLVHWPLAVFYKHVTLDPLSTAEQIVLLVVCILLAEILYWSVENRFRLKGRFVLNAN